MSQLPRNPGMFARSMFARTDLVEMYDMLLWVEFNWELWGYTCRFCRRGSVTVIDNEGPEEIVELLTKMSHARFCLAAYELGLPVEEA